MGTKIILNELIPSDVQLVPDFLVATVEILSDLAIHDDIIFGVKLCLDEAIINAIKHGNRSDHGLSVHILIETQGNKLIIQVDDQGKGFNYQDIPNPTTEENIGKFHGRGLYLIMNFMDKVEFMNEGRTIKMIKEI